MPDDLGSLTERVDVQRATSVLDSTGDPQLTWATVRTPWARVSAMGGTETYMAGQTQAVLQVRFRIQAGSNPVLPTDRIVWRGQVHDITGVFWEATRTWQDLWTVQRRVGAEVAGG